MIQPLRTAFCAATALAALAITLPVAQAQPSHSAGSCFYITQVSGMKADGARTIYARVSGRTIFRFDLANDCNSLKGNSDTLVLRPANSGSICAPLDMTIGTRESGEECIVKSIARLSDDEAAALPKSVQPPG
ncbi:MAG: hypothetical protein ACHP7N_02765 [Caulobacterales bacterium]